MPVAHPHPSPFESQHDERIENRDQRQPVATIETLRQIVRVEQTDYTDVAAVVVSVADVNAGILVRLQATGFDIPTFVAVEGDEHLSPDYLPFVSGVFALLAGASKPFYMAQLEAAADAYEQALLPPFFKTLKTYVEMENSTFACPGHQGGSSSANTRPAGSSSISTVRLCSVPICATPTSSWAIC